MLGSSSAYAAILRLRSSKARVWEGVGLARIVVGCASPKRTRLRVRLARSCRRVRKLWTGWPSSVRLRAALRRAAGETLALATGDGRCAAAAAGLSWAGLDQLLDLQGAEGGETARVARSRSRSSRATPPI